MVDFIDEVNDDLRQQQFTRFWQRVGAYVVAVSVVIVLATVGTVLWQNYRESRQNAAAEAFLAADKDARSQRYEEAAREYAAVAKKDAQGFTELAKMREAYVLSKAGENGKAIAAYNTVINDAGADKGARALSRIYAAMLMTRENQPAEEIQKMLSPLAKNNDNPFSAFAREQIAYVVLQDGDAKKAHGILVELSTDLTAPPSLRRRAQAQVASVSEQVDGAAAPAAQ